jgi:hypothetical protein
VSQARIFGDARVSAVVGVTLLLSAWLVLNDAYQKRGKRPPLALRPFTWWA